MEKSDFIWFDGKFVDWDSAQINVMTHTLHYGTGVFEGIRARNTEKVSQFLDLMTMLIDYLLQLIRII